MNGLMIDEKQGSTLYLWQKLH